MDIDSQISMEGTLSDFEIKFLEQKMQQTTKISANDGDTAANRKQLRKAKIISLKQKIKEATKNFELSHMKLEYFANSLSSQIQKRQEEIQRIAVIIKQYQEQIIQRNNDIKDLQYLWEKKKQTKDANLSFGSEGSIKSVKKRNYIKKQSPPPRTTRHNKQKSSDMLSARSKGKQKTDKQLFPNNTVSQKKLPSPNKPAIKKSSEKNLKNSSEKLQSTSKGKKSKPLRNFIF